MQAQAVFYDDIIDESIEMQIMHPVMFDAYLAEGWRLLGRSVVRHSIATCRNKMCRTIPLRICLEGFTFSRSQQKLLRKNADLPQHYGPISLNSAKETLFWQHSERFHERRPHAIASFLSRNPHREPVEGMEFTIGSNPEQPQACSFMHIGDEAVSATYCFFDPQFSNLSLGAYTMLLEIEKARALGKKYYYHGYAYDVPSQFDYKLNFNNLEAFDWRTGEWLPCARQPVRHWWGLIEAPFTS